MTASLALLGLWSAARSWWFPAALPQRWGIERMSFRHVGVFPEQAAHWEWVNGKVRAEKERAPDKPLKILNLFGYTGLASLLPATEGAQVTHVPLAKMTKEDLKAFAAKWPGTVAATHLKGSVDYRTPDYSEPVLLVMDMALTAQT